MLLYGGSDHSLWALRRTTAPSRPIQVAVEADGEPLSDGGFVTTHPSLTLRFSQSGCVDVAHSTVRIDGVVQDLAGMAANDEITLAPALKEGMHVLEATMEPATWDPVPVTVRDTFLATARLSL